MATMFKWVNGSEHDFDTLPEQSKRALINRAVTRIVGNEASSYVLGRAKQHLAKESNKKAKDITGRMAADWIKENPDIETQWETEFHDAKLDAIVNGTLGVRAEGVSSFEREVYRIARADVVALLAAHGVSFPEDDETVQTANGAVTGDQLIERYMANKKNAETVHNKATASLEAKRLAREAKAAERDALVNSNAAKALGL